LPPDSSTRVHRHVSIHGSKPGRRIDAESECVLTITETVVQVQ
jgi:hypothetical protein